MRLLYAVVFLALLLSGCTAPAPLTSLPVTPDVAMPMPTLASAGRSLEVSQMISVQYQQDRVTFEAHISITPEKFIMVGLDGFGRKAVTITWDKNGVVYESAPFVPKQLRPENILSDIVMLYWPQAPIRRALEGTGLRLVTGKHSRAVMQGDKKILEVEYKDAHPWNGRLHYRNFVWGYAMEIQSVEMGL